MPGPVRSACLSSIWGLYLRIYYTLVCATLEGVPMGPLRKPEVMSPAGYWPQLRAAIEAGADAVYFGLKHFSARAKVGFSLAELPEAMATLGQPEQCAALPLDSEAPGLLLYTSGTTGRPKGAVHRQCRRAGADGQGDLPDVRSPARRPLLVGLRHRLDDGAVGDYRELGGAIMLYEGPPDDPTAERFWQMIEHRVTTLGFHRRPSGC